MVGRYTRVGRCAGLKTVVEDGRARHGEGRTEAEKRDSIELVGDYGGNAISVCAISERFSAPILMSIKLKKTHIDRTVPPIPLTSGDHSTAKYIPVSPTGMSNES